MKLHRLEFQAIGPFAGRHVIDFDALGADGLFLLEGPTGSGKSTIIDALTFALYGQTAAEATGETRIRSSHVGPEVESYVDLVATVAGGTLRIRRTPAYQRKKLRGAGTTEEKPTATLWRLRPEDVDALGALGTDAGGMGGAGGGTAGGTVLPEGEHLASGAREVSTEAAALIGLTREQFTQTVVLPQGEFARFLRSTSEEREAILQRIFATQLYEDVATALADRAREHKRAQDTAATALRAGAARYAERLPEGAEDGEAEAPVEAEPGVDAAGEAVDDGVGSDDGALFDLLAPATDAAAAADFADQPDASSVPPPPAEPTLPAEPAPTPRERLDAAVDLVVRGEADGVDAIEALVEHVDARLARELNAHREARDTAAAAARAARTHLDYQRRLADAIARRSALLTRRAALEEGAEQADADAVRLADAERAARVLPLVTASADARVALRDAVDDADEAVAALDALPGVTAASGAADKNRSEVDATGPARAAQAARTALDALRMDGEQPADDRDDGRSSGRRASSTDALVAATAVARTHADAVTSRRGGLTEVLRIEAGLAGRRADLDAEAARIATLREQEEALHAELDERPARRSATTEKIADARARATAAGDAATAEYRARTRLDAARKAEKAAAAVDNARTAATVAAAAAHAAVEAEATLRRRRIEGIAGELAARLVAGEPCEVCGSTSHPAPAEPGPDMPTPEQIEAAEERRRDAEAAQAAAATALGTAENTLAHWQDAAGGLDVAAAQDAHREAKSALDAATTAAAEATALEADREAFDRATEELRGSAERAATDLAQARTRLTAAEEALAADGATVEEARDGAESVASRVATLDREASTTRTLAHALDAVASRAQALREAEDRATGALDEERFADAGAARAAALPAAERTALRHRLRDRDAERQRVTDGLAAPDVAALTGEETTDVPTAEEAAESTEAASSAAAQAFGTADARATAAREDGARLLAEARGQVDAIAEAAPYVRLASLAGAGEASVRRIPLPTFVLMRRFEDMVAAANTRLTAMSGGRYALRRTDREEGARARKIGLGLEVLDHQTDAARAPNTLSGGETFYVSLSLALGLADVVRAEAGGVDLGTLLIDEGFGSLDQETLDVVMAELLRLRDAGRTVGLVSHVTEMQRMIQDKIEVRRVDGRGSTLSVNWMGA